MKIGIGYLPVRLKRRPGSKKSEGKTSPALITAQISISEAFFLNFEPHFGCQNPSKNDLWEPLNRDNVTAIIIDSIKLIMLPFCHAPIHKWLPSSALPKKYGTSFPSDSLSRNSQAQSRFPLPEQQWNGKRFERCLSLLIVA